VLGVIESWRAHQPGSDFLERVKRHQNEQPSIAAPPIGHATAAGCIATGSRSAGQRIFS